METESLLVRMIMFRLPDFLAIIGLILALLGFTRLESKAKFNLTTGIIALITAALYAIRLATTIGWYDFALTICWVIIATLWLRKWRRLNKCK